MALSVEEATPGYLAGAAAAVDTAAMVQALQSLYAAGDTAGLWPQADAVLRRVTGATKVMLVHWKEEDGDWVLQMPDGGAVVIGADTFAQVPLALLWHAQQERAPFLVADALSDSRFALDPYFHGMRSCCAMVVPIVSRATLRAMLVFECRDAGGAFGSAQLDAASTVASQIARSLENARLHERLERKVAEQTQQLREAQTQLAEMSRRDGMAQIAADVLHNVANVLTSVNVSAHVVSRQVQRSPASRLGDVAKLLNQEASDLPNFFGPAGRGRHLPSFLQELSAALEAERQDLLAELARLRGSVDHIKNVISMQQASVRVAHLESVNVADLLEDAIRIQEPLLSKDGVQLSRDYSPVEAASLDKTRVMQILVNLLQNARQAMAGVETDRQIGVALRQAGGCIIVSIRDNGCGIEAGNLERIFSHGFTTKPGGHGFGLHSCAIAAGEMSGSLTVQSDGPGTGATFVLQLPLSVPS